MYLYSLFYSVCVRARAKVCFVARNAHTCLSDEKGIRLSISIPLKLSPCRTNLARQLCLRSLHGKNVAVKDRPQRLMSKLNLLCSMHNGAGCQNVLTQWMLKGKCLRLLKIAHATWSHLHVHVHANERSYTRTHDRQARTERHTLTDRHTYTRIYQTLYLQKLMVLI